MSVEVSVERLEFHGEAAKIITDAYHRDIDEEVVYSFELDGVEMYRGNVDLSTYNEKNEEYHSVSCNIGEVGAKTTFNNRSETDIDLNDTKTIDGEDLAYVPTWMEQELPIKHLLYTNILEQKEEVEWAIGHGASGASEGGNSTELVFDTSTVNEFGIVNDEMTLFYKDEDFDKTFGEDTVMSADFSVKLKFTNKSVVFYGEGTRVLSFFVEVVSGETVLCSGPFDSEVGDEYNFECHLDNIPTSNSLFFRIREFHMPDTYSWNVMVAITSAKVTMQMYDNIENSHVIAKMLPIHEVLNTIVESASENAMTVKSDWYGRPDSVVNPTPTSIFGGGSLKALTNGYKIRGLFAEDSDVDDDSNKRAMALSFKTAIQSLDAMDCIGWAFENTNDGMFVRIEPWSWFYKNQTLMSIDDAEKVDVDIDTKRIITELKIGYKKYATNSEYNSIDSIHGERQYVSKIKAVSNSKDVKCSFIADNYAIEETRRAKDDIKPIEEFKYDENIFVIELACKRSTMTYIIPRGIKLASGIGRPGEYINVRISPYFNAMRWKSYLFQANSASGMDCKTGTINYKAGYTTIEAIGNSYLSAQGKPIFGTTHKEDDEITNERSVMVAEKLTLSYPISNFQYKAIVANPYGMINVNGRECWIDSFTYSFKDGMADFILIPKYV